MKLLLICLLLFSCHPPDPEVERVRQVNERLTRLEQNIQEVKLRRCFEDINRIALMDAIHEYKQAKEILR